MMTRKGKKRAQQEAQKLIERYAIASPPVPVERIARALGATIQYAPLDDELSGMVFLKGGTPIIGVNALHHPNRQRFSIAHEIGHLVLHRDRISTTVHVDKQYPLLRRDAGSSAGVDLMEIEANAFAAQLLMPERLLPIEAMTPLDIDDEVRIELLAKRFRVSTSAMRYRLLGFFFE